MYNYKYNGKELQETGMYDYGARMYIPDIGRWGVVDPMAESSLDLTPYRFSGNNPIIFTDLNGLWEFEYDSKTSKLSLKKSNENDNLVSFMKESGLDKSEIKNLLFGGGKKGQKSMDAFFGGSNTSINVSELSGKLGNMLNGMEEGLSNGNIKLSNNKSDQADDTINNCHNCTINLTSDGKVDSKPLGKLNNLDSYVTNQNLFDDTLVDKYQNVSTPRLGDAIRYSKDGGNLTTHGSVFLLNKLNDIQIFTKNGFQNSSPYQIMMQSKIVQKYGYPTGIQNKDVKTETATGVQSNVVNDKTVFYRKN